MHDYPMLVKQLGSFLDPALIHNLQIPPRISHLPLIVHTAKGRAIYLACFDRGWFRLVAHHVLQFGCLHFYVGSLSGAQGDLLLLHLLSVTVSDCLRLVLTVMLLSYSHLGRVD